MISVKREVESCLMSQCCEQREFSLVSFENAQRVLKSHRHWLPLVLPEDKCMLLEGGEYSG